ncbi:hypothetical protein EXIGLDRAFT_681055 [Exidia glandulosa HHB12029]|uniref:Exocyst complex component EXO84 n=1 Tax=Exidia glandulosa HHB12029 TaxID=1314781 RepID=A0A165E9C5_EXIGL|nr:hypothetical protein EXIGLDRAFT_681055 [Exidia glandulosa HHB12029]
MQSLRTRKPSEGASTLRKPSTRNKLAKPGAGGREISAPIKAPGVGLRGGAGVGGDANARKSRLDDKIKKRMSMRYADGPRMREDVPDMPSLPAGVGATRREPRLSEREPQLRDSRKSDELDLSAMSAENFDPDAYLKTKLGNSTEAELRSLQSTLQATKASTATDLQRNVFKNYAEFMLISKEISTLENDMLDLKESLSEWKNMPELLKMDETTAASAGGTIDRRRTFRSSVADLKTLYASQLQTLHSFIEGSAKFVPATPGRHIVIETGDMVALNTATYKVEYPVHFVLLDDALLVARKRKQRGGGSSKSEGGKLVAEKCWSLNEIVVVDVKDTADLANLIKIRHAKEIHVYRTSRTADKKQLLLAFRQVAEELAAKKRKEREGENERRKSVWTGNAPKMSAPTEAMPALPAWLSSMAPPNVGDPADGKTKNEQDSRWIDNFCDKLTVAIALREWEEAVQLVEEGEKKQATISALAPKLSALTKSLVSALLHTLSSTTNRKSHVVLLASLLARLKSTPAAVTTFLQARGEIARKRVRSIAMEGDIVNYVCDLCVVVFCGIKHTADWFLASWKEHEVASYFVQWAREQIEAFAILFRKQVYGTDMTRKVMTDALTLVRQQNKKFLQDNGLDFSFLLEDLLTPPQSPDAHLAHSRTNSLGGTKAYTLPAPAALQAVDKPRISPFRGATTVMSPEISSPPPPPIESPQQPQQQRSVVAEPRSVAAEQSSLSSSTSSSRTTASSASTNTTRPLKLNLNNGSSSNVVATQGPGPLSPTFSSLGPPPDNGLRPVTPSRTPVPRSPLPPRSPNPGHTPTYSQSQSHSAHTSTYSSTSSTYGNTSSGYGSASATYGAGVRSPGPTRSRSRAGSQSEGEDGYRRPPRPRDADMPPVSGRRTPMATPRSAMGMGIVRPPSSNSNAGGVVRAPTVAKREGMI